MLGAKSPPFILTRIFIRLLGLISFVSGLYFVVFGIRLILLESHTWYYVTLGVLLLLGGYLLMRLRASGVWIFGLLFIISIIWSALDAGFDFWKHFSNLFALAIATFLVVLCYFPLMRADGRRAGRTTYGVGALLFLTIIGFTASAFYPKNVVFPLLDESVAIAVTPQTQQKNWLHWGNDAAGRRFAALDQITPENVGELQVAWTLRTGDIAYNKGSGAEDQNTPLQIGDTLYVCTPYNKILAINVDSGKEIWRFDSKNNSPAWQRCRGLGYYSDKDTVDNIIDRHENADNGQCHSRLFMPTGDARLIAINAHTGKPCVDFGKNGTVDLSVGMGEIKPGFYQQTSAPLVAGKLVVVGGRVADNSSTDAPAGVVRAFDVHTGKLVWAWDPGNPEITALPPEGQTYTRGTPNVWAAMSYDPKLDLIFMPTGNATPDFWGGHRSALDDKYSSSVVAVEASTGKVRWHYQLVHHDLWDFDTPAQPVLVDVPLRDGKTALGLVQVTKQGEIFLLNRETGEPLADVVEKPAPAGNVSGERYSPTQPYSVGMPSIGNGDLSEADMWGATPFDQLLCRIAFRKARHEGVFTPPGLDLSLQMPGSLGGMNWGSVSVDPTLNYIFVNDMRLGSTNYLLPRKDMPKNVSPDKTGIVPMEGTPYGAMRMRFVSPLGIPCQKPPFGTMTAIDLKTRQIVWQVPVGTLEDTGPFNIATRLSVPIGMPTLGPSLATQSGLVFFGGTQDNYLRAFNSRSGKQVWKGRLPVGSQGGPMSYISPKTGKQYIVITASGAYLSPKRGDYVIAYSLPDKPKKPKNK